MIKLPKSVYPTFVVNQLTAENKMKINRYNTVMNVIIFSGQYIIGQSAHQKLL